MEKTLASLRKVEILQKEIIDKISSKYLLEEFINEFSIYEICKKALLENKTEFDYKFDSENGDSLEFSILVELFNNEICKCDIIKFNETLC